MNNLKKYFANNRYYKGKPKNDREARNLTTRKAMKYLGDFKNGWVLHYTKNPIAVIRQGFMGLVGDKDIIWRTYACPALREIGKGYCFAFDANDENHFSYDYGPYALMFRVSGIKAYNCVDEEPQVIFKAENANLKECFMLTFSADTESDYDGEGEPYTSYRNMTINVINPYTKKTVFSTPDMKRAIEWVKTNYRQYKKLNSFNNIRKYKSVDDTLEQTTKEVLNYIKNELGRNVIGVFNDNYHTTKEYVIVLPADEYASKGKIRKALGFKPKDYTCDVRNNIILSFEYDIQRHFIRRFIGDDVQGDYFNIIRLSYDNTETLEHKIKSTVKSVLKECVNKILNEGTNGNVVTLYHGGNKNEDPEMYPVYWLTDSKTMALDYALNNDWPCVYRVTIDTSKLSYENHVEHYDKYFNNAYCIGLRYLTPIINIEPLTEEETNEIEYDLNITEAIKSVLKEYINENKQQQLQTILNTNPASKNNRHTWIRTVDDIKTYQETLAEYFPINETNYDLTPDFKDKDVRQALKTNKITIYSSYPIKPGVFVTPSKMEAQSYAGNNNIYSKSVELSDVAWIDPLQGQYTNTP